MERYYGEFGGNIKFKINYMTKIEEKYSKSTYGNVRNLLVMAKLYEETYGKDVYDFSIAEATSMLRGLRARTKNSLKQKISVYTSYINEAINEGVTENKTNAMECISSKDYDKLIDINANRGRYITRDELYAYVAGLNNSVDRALFMLLFDGVMGDNYINLTNIKLEDIDKDTMVAKLFDGGEVQLSEVTYNICLDAYEEDEYESYGETGLIKPMVMNEYIIRSSLRRKGSEYEPLSPSAIRTKIDLFKKMLGIASLTGRSIYLSGVAQKLIEENEDNIHLTLAELDKWLTNHHVYTNAQEFKSILNAIHGRLSLDNVI